ncbi:endonuclease MutS2 [bacterium]|nr:endonuclease MutS2 [bacterium]
MEKQFSITTLEFEKIKEHLSRFVLTAMSEEKVNSLFPNPKLDLIESLLDTLVEMHDILKYDDTFPIDELKDARPLLKKISVEGRFLNPAELLQLLLTITSSRRIKSYIKNRIEKYPLLFKITDVLHSYPAVEERIQRTIDEQGAIRDTASPKLRQIRRDLDQKTLQLRKKLESLARTYTKEGYAQDEIVTVRDGRMVIPVKDEYKNTVRGFIHDASASGQTVFIEPAEALELNNELRKLGLEETHEIERILTEITNEIRMSLSELQADSSVLAEIEFLYVKARFTNQINGVKPHLNVDGKIVFKNALHPLLLLKEQYKLPGERHPIIPLNLSIGDDYRTLIISGPNAGGKTVALKTVGLLVLMVQAGLLIPVEPGTHVSVFDQVFADIGDEQSIENDLSTFSSHVRNLSNMVDRVNERTLILIDEMGSGTDPKEGASLAIAILGRFNSCKAISIITTHHGALKAFAHNTEGIHNGSMEFDQATLQPTYVFRAGIPGSSYAFEISTRMGLDSKVIEQAKVISGSESQRLENLIQDLQHQTRIYDQKLSDIEREKTRLEGLTKFYDQRAGELKKREKELKQKALLEKRELIDNLNKKIEAAIQSIKASQAGKEEIQTAKKLIGDENQKTSDELERLKDLPDESEVPAEGKMNERVFLKSMGLDGTIIAEADESGHVLVAIGNLKIKATVNQLVKSKEQKQKKELLREHVRWDTEDIGNEIDLRGMTTEEAIYQADKYISDAHVMGFRQIALIHGKGGGVLRKKIAEYLKKNHRVRSYRLGQWGEGDTGVTIVELTED